MPGSVFKTVVGLNKVPGGFDSHPPPPSLKGFILDANYLFASLMWGSVGVAYFVYGRKQMCLSALVGGQHLQRVGRGLRAAHFPRAGRLGLTFAGEAIE